MRILLLLYLLLSLLMFPSVGCRRQQTLFPCHWPAAGGEFDSLTNKLENQFNEFETSDSILSTICNMERLAMADSGDLKRSRLLYWKARFVGRFKGDDSSVVLIKEALELNDSIRYGYDRLRMLSYLYNKSDSIDGGSRYRHYAECMEYAHKIGDMSFEAYSAINMGTLLGDIGEYDKALVHMYLADSLNNVLGYRKLAVKNKINEARVLSEMGESKKCDSILKSLLWHPYFKGDTAAINLLHRNIYGNDNCNIEYLYRAYNDIRYNERFRHLRGFYCVLLMEYSYNNERFDSMRYYGEMAKLDLPYVKEYGHLAMFWYYLGLANMIDNQTDSALFCRLRYEDYVDSMHRLQRTAEVFRLSAMREMERREERYAASISRRNIAMALVVALLVMSGVAACWILNRRRLKHRAIAMANELELEKARKKMAATAISIEEKDKVLGVLKTGLSELREEGGMNEGNVRQMESAIKNHMLEYSTDESFQKMFDVVNPGFKQRLEARCPTLADSYVRLACYMLMGLDNKKIARLMMIKPESVHQARWRLRQRLGLKDGETLESALNALNENL